LLQGILIDITKDKLVEEELRVHRRRLEDMVTKRTTQIEKQAAVYKSANANLASKLDACTLAGSALKQHANQLADLYHNAPCSYHTLDPDGMLIQINDTGLEWLGRTREEVEGKMKFNELLTPASGKIFLESYPHLKKSGWIRELELELTRKDGTTLSVLLSAKAIKGTGGRFVMTLHDA
jgi:PAS domain S-box-containing protein